ncbi:MAG TPA: hypothetical protein DDZ37_02235 [Spirochaetaceae bacterium]|nr:hypothetical protein [Spirochaetaceae bacterium]
MQRRYGAYAALLAIFVLLFSGCDALISNAFKEVNLGQPSAEKLKEADAATLLEDSGISTGSVSDAFIETIVDDTETMNAVLETLQATVDDPTAAPSDVQAAQALILDIKLADIGADEVADNLNTAIGELTNLASEDGGEDIEPADIIDALLPPSLADDPDKLAEFIDNIEALAGDVDTLAAKIDDNGGTVAEGLDIATMAQTAAIVKFVEIVDPAVGYATTGEAIADLVEDLKDPDFEPDMNDYFASEPDIASLADDPTLQTLFTAAGMGDLLEQLSGGDS